MFAAYAAGGGGNTCQGKTVTSTAALLV